MSIVQMQKSAVLLFLLSSAALADADADAPSCPRPPTQTLGLTCVGFLRPSLPACIFGDP